MAKRVRLPAESWRSTQPMPAKHFVAFVEHMNSKGVSGRELARRLDSGVNSITGWKRDGAPGYIALAAQAIDLGLAPWVPPTKRKPVKAAAPDGKPRKVTPAPKAPADEPEPETKPARDGKPRRVRKITTKGGADV